MLAAVATLWPVLTCSFGGWDDDMNVRANPYLNPPSWSGVVRYWRAEAADLYIPVTYTLWSFIAALAPRHPDGRLGPAAFHLVNLLLHLAAALCAFEILRGCASRATPPQPVDTRNVTSETHGAIEIEIGKVAAAGIGALVFAVHPVQVESIAWVAGLKDVLAGALALGAIALFVCRRDDGIARQVAATIVFALAVLAKPSAVVAPAMAVLIDLLIRRRWLIASRLWLIPWLAIAIVILILTRRAQPAPWINAGVPPAKRFLIAGDALAFYLGKLVWPVNLGVDYGRTPQVALARSFIGLIWLLPAFLACIAIWWWRRRCDPLPLAALALFIVGVAPVLGLVPFDFQAYSTVADHYLYLAMLGPALFVMWINLRYASRATWMLSAIALLALAVLSFRQTWTWRDTLSIARQATAVNPRSFAWHDRAAMSLFYEHGDAEGALVSARHAVEANPGYGIGWQDLGLLYAALNRPSDAADAYRRAVATDRYNVQAHIGLANALADMGQRDEAIAQYRSALQIDPRNIVAMSNLAGVLAGNDQLEEAIELYRAAITIDDGFAPARQGLARALDQLARRRAAPPARH